MQKYRQRFHSENEHTVIELGPNEFYDESDRLGLFDSDEEPHKYLTVQNVKEEKS